MSAAVPDRNEPGEHDENCWIACPHDTPPAAGGAEGDA